MPDRRRCTWLHPDKRPDRQPAHPAIRAAQAKIAAARTSRAYVPIVAHTGTRIRGTRIRRRGGPITEFDFAAEFDFVIVGAGSAGCLLANRLSADPGNRVLLIEGRRR